MCFCLEFFATDINQKKAIARPQRRSQDLKGDRKTSKAIAKPQRRSQNLNRHQLQKGFQSWVETITEKLGLELIHIDGKTLRGSYDREEKLKALHSVSAWSSEHNLVLAQQKVDSKTNEIKAIPMLLNLLNLKGAVVTVDAMGTQIGIVNSILDFR